MQLLNSALIYFYVLFNLPHVANHKYGLVLRSLSIALQTRWVLISKFKMLANKPFVKSFDILLIQGYKVNIYNQS